MELVLARMISVSLKSSPGGKEQGQNLSVQILLKASPSELEVNKKFDLVLNELDHHHLSEDKSLQLKSFEDLIQWLDKRFIQEGILTNEIRLQIDSKKSLSLRKQA